MAKTEEQKPEPPRSTRTSSSVAVLVLLLAIAWIGYSRACSSWRDKTKADDQKFCDEWLGFYEKVCKEKPETCPEGPRKMARCE